MIYIKNVSGEVKQLHIKEFAIDEVYEILEADRKNWANNDDVIVAITNEDFEIHNHLGAISGINNQINHLKSIAPIDSKTYPFSNKKLEDGKSLFRRKHGMSIGLTSLATTNATFTLPYNHCKINEIEAVGAVAGDYVNIKVLDSVNGDYTGTPNAVLNQFGFNVYLSPDHYKDKCNYDADLYLGMQLKIEYTNSQDNTRTVYTNFGLHEVV